MAQPVEVLPYKLDMSSIPGTHIKMEERANSIKLTFDLNTCTVTHVPFLTSAHTIQNKRWS